MSSTSSRRSSCSSRREGWGLWRWTEGWRGRGWGLALLLRLLLFVMVVVVVVVKKWLLLFPVAVLVRILVLLGGVGDSYLLA
jgi:hypothetical protein